MTRAREKIGRDGTHAVSPFPPKKRETKRKPALNMRRILAMMTLVLVVSNSMVFFGMKSSPGDCSGRLPVMDTGQSRQSAGEISAFVF